MPKTINLNHVRNHLRRGNAHVLILGAGTQWDLCRKQKRLLSSWSSVLCTQVEWILKLLDLAVSKHSCVGNKCQNHATFYQGDDRDCTSADFYKYLYCTGCKSQHHSFNFTRLSNAEKSYGAGLTVVSLLVTAPEKTLIEMYKRKYPDSTNILSSFWINGHGSYLDQEGIIEVSTVTSTCTNEILNTSDEHVQWQMSDRACNDPRLNWSEFAAQQGDSSPPFDPLDQRHLNVHARLTAQHSEAIKGFVKEALKCPVCKQDYALELQQRRSQKVLACR